MAKIVMIIGLPGSGKTTLLSKVEGDVVVFDDIVRLEELPHEIHDGQTVYIATPHFCVSWKEAVDKLERRYPNVPIELIFFENDPEAAIRNVNNRKDGRVVREHYIRYLSNNYLIPKDVTTLPIFR